MVSKDQRRRQLAREKYERQQQRRAQQRTKVRKRNAAIAGAVVVGGSHGKGEVFKGDVLVGYADVSKANVGAQVGGQSYSQVVFFENEGSYARFTGGTMELDAKASAVAASAAKPCVALMSVSPDPSVWMIRHPPL